MLRQVTCFIDYAAQVIVVWAAPVAVQVCLLLSSASWAKCMLDSRKFGLKFALEWPGSSCGDRLQESCLRMVVVASKVLDVILDYVKARAVLAT